jgi:hypothetical protein
MNTTNFFDQNNNVNSQRRKLNDTMFNSKYPGESARGGTTFTGRHMTMRMDNNGRVMSWGLNDGRGLHFDSNNRKRNGIAQF